MCYIRHDRDIHNAIKCVTLILVCTSTSVISVVLLGAVYAHSTSVSWFNANRGKESLVEISFSMCHQWSQTVLVIHKVMSLYVYILYICIPACFVWFQSSVQTMEIFTLFVFSVWTDISVEAVSPDEHRRFEENKKDMDRYLAPYPYDRWVCCDENQGVENPQRDLKGGWGCLMSLSWLEFQGCLLIPLSCLLSYFSA